jgi:hypothetical protein
LIRFISFLLGKPYEPCASCATLKEQIAYERDENKRLIETLLNIVKPSVTQAAPIEVQPIQQAAGTFTRRRAILEERDRQEALIKQQKKFIAVPDDKISQLEKELGVEAPDLRRAEEGI